MSLSSLVKLAPEVYDPSVSELLDASMELKTIGAIRSFIQLKGQGADPSMMRFLHQLVSMLEEQHWSEVAKPEKKRLLAEIQQLLA
ncbi:TfoX/Sxy family DNA transformation protein [Dongshaea marina]|uniref:TfoX/Sxy family DNA transformation protein n=1 Tax=Dongshaea marina TaxID=2047966 RepID=UPI000D3E6AE3|nr:TfoX/Sxy family DNA transformation protein [Dongshaea marina]